MWSPYFYICVNGNGLYCMCQWRWRLLCVVRWNCRVVLADHADAPDDFTKKMKSLKFCRPMRLTSFVSDADQSPLFLSRWSLVDFWVCRPGRPRSINFLSIDQLCHPIPLHPSTEWSLVKHASHKSTIAHWLFYRWSTTTTIHRRLCDWMVDFIEERLTGARI